VEWSPEFSVGLPDIDAQHQELFRRLGALTDATGLASKAEIVRLLDFLDSYVVEHFRDEEAAMEELKFPYVAMHTAAHARFVLELKSIEAEFAATGATAWLATRLEGAVTDWLKRHILGMDQHFGRYVLARRELEKHQR
jgi:hemerythrin-like metal-binding protein